MDDKTQGSTIYNQIPEDQFAMPSQPPAVQQQPPSPPPPPPVEPKGTFSPKNLIKLLIGLFAVGFVLFILFSFIFPNINKKEEKVTLTFWGLFEESQVFTPIIAEFEKNNPKITVKYEKQDIKDYRERLTTRALNGTGPDIFRFHNTWYPMLNQLLLPLPGDTISKEDFKNSFYPVAQKDLIKNGAIFGIPLEIDTLSLFVNSEIFRQAGVSVPTNWDDFINASRNLTVKDSTGKIQTAGVAFGTFENVTHSPDIVSLLMAQNGVNLDDLSSSTDRVGDALNFYSAFALPPGNVWDQTLDQSILAFSKGNLAMYFGYYWDYFTIKTNNKDLVFDVVAVPQLSFPNAEIASYYPMGVSAKSKNQKEALLFLKFLSSKDIQNKIYQEEAKTRSFGAPPSRMDLADNLKNTPLYSFVSKAKNANSSFFTGETFDNGLNAELNNLLATAINSILSGDSPSTAAESLSSSFSQVLAKYKTEQN